MRHLIYLHQYYYKTVIINLLQDFQDSLSSKKLEEVEEIVEEEFKRH